MLNLEKDINWELFTSEEKEKLVDAFKSGETSALCCLPEVPINTPEKEKEIEKMVLELRGVSVDDELRVKDELNQFWRDIDTSTMTPEIEADWQAKIDAEIKEKKALLLEKQKELGLEVDSTIEEPVVEEKKEITYTCPDCQKVFKSRIGLAGHSKTHLKQ
jgi:hypothetical protein